MENQTRLLPFKTIACIILCWSLVFFWKLPGLFINYTIHFWYWYSKGIRNSNEYYCAL